MAGEIGHVVYAARLLTYLGERVQDPLYWVGTVFPDIRHLGAVSRHRTHPEHVSLHTLIGQTDFATGMRVHAWLDVTRERYLYQVHIKENLPWHPFTPHALKLVEDELLYAHYEDWDLIHRLLNKVYEEELYYVNESKTVHQWHTVLQKYFAEPPTNTTRRGLSVGIGLSENSANEINEIVARLRDNRRTKEILQDFWRYLEDILR